jgi:hypothetical protein
MKPCWFIPIALLIPLRLSATDTQVGARVATITINPREITVLHLRPEFESTIRMPEEVTSVILGSPGEFKAEHNEGEPEYVYVKPITKQAAQSNLLIATKSGQHVTLELVSEGANAPNQSQPVDFLIEYRSARSFLISSESGAPCDPSEALDKQTDSGSPRRKRALAVAFVLCATLVTPLRAHGQFGDIFQGIFMDIQDDMGSSLKAINQITQSVQKLFQTTMWPLAAINQARGFVSNSMSSFRGQMNQIFNTRFSSATLAGPQRFESILHSRLSTQIPALQTGLSTTFGVVPRPTWPHRRTA